MSNHFLPEGNGLAIAPLPSLAEGHVEGPSALINALISATSTPPEQGFSQPLRISLRPAGSASACHRLLAFWLRPDAAWEALFGPLQAWREQLPAERRRKPLLVLAKAEGHWDLPEAPSLEFARLLQEKDPLGAPDGRALICAHSAAAPLHEALYRALGWYLGILSPRETEPLPEGALVLRSGLSNIRWNLPFPAKVCVRKSRHGLRAKKNDPPSQTFAIAHGLRLTVDWKGPFLWGSWRAEKEQARFLTLGYRGGSAIRGGMTVGFANEGPSKARFHAALERHFINVGFGRETSDRYLERAVRSIAREVTENSHLQNVMDGTYGELLCAPWRQPLPLFEAAAFPGEGPIEPSPAELPDSGEPGTQRFAAEGLHAWLREAREVQVVISNGKPRQKPARGVLAGRYPGSTNAA